MFEKNNQQRGPLQFPTYFERWRADLRFTRVLGELHDSLLSVRSDLGELESVINNVLIDGGVRENGCLLLCPWIGRGGGANGSIECFVHGLAPAVSTNRHGP